MGHSMASFRPETHKTLVSLLIEKRKEKGLSLRNVTAKLPDWMGYQFSTLAKIERGERDISYAELRELAQVLGTDVTTLATRVEEIVTAKLKVQVLPRKKK